MSNSTFWSDLHLDHPKALQVREWFPTLKEYQEYVCDIWIDKVTPRTTIYLLGDIAFTWEGLGILKKLPGKKLLVGGNHDHTRNSTRDLLEVYDEIYGLHRHRSGLWLSHAPIHHSELRGKLNVHGHTHEKIIQDPRYINVCIEHLRDGPVDLELIRSGEYRTWRDNK